MPRWAIRPLLYASQEPNYRSPKAKAIGTSEHGHWVVFGRLYIAYYFSRRVLATFTLAPRSTHNNTAERSGISGTIASRLLPVAIFLGC